MSIGEANNPEEAHLFEEAIKGNYALLGFEDIDWSDDKFESREAIIEACKAHGDQNGTVDARSGMVQMPFIFRNWVRKGDIVIVSKGNGLFRAIGEFMGGYEFAHRPEGGYAHRRAVRWLWIDRDGVPVGEICSRKFSQKSIYALYDAELNVPALERYMNSQQTEGPSEPEPFVLIVDEINRANISKVFGELITLLEPDKRLGHLHLPAFGLQAEFLMQPAGVDCPVSAGGAYRFVVTDRIRFHRLDPRARFGRGAEVPLAEVPPRAFSEVLRDADLVTSVASIGLDPGCHLLGIEDLHFHDLRHEGVTRLFELGCNIPHAAAVSGHRSWSSLKRYTHIRSGRCVGPGKAYRTGLPSAGAGSCRECRGNSLAARSGPVDVRFLGRRGRGASAGGGGARVSDPSTLRIRIRPGASGARGGIGGVCAQGNTCGS